MTNRVVGLAAAPAPILAAVWLAVVGLTLVSFARLFVALFLGEVRGPVEAEHRWPTIVASGGILATFFLLEATANDLYALVRPLASLLPG